MTSILVKKEIRQRETCTERKQGKQREDSHPQATEYQQAQKLGGGLDRLPLAASEGINLLTLAFWTSNLQDCEVTNFCYSKPPNLWYFVTVALGN